ncbi:hypothetical protein CEUSTIGMA_g10767.t1 [Chlamydomonas eustigma]|uniref:Myb-like domain-containing protein n=1 Tax=Chlamydomonas eustigma TaxID=1157962 RepID=A0A250XK90_9CHLO|nr:hypothetical protein CEUSTIGMA_g10767.t1 [Chlamydomonas eustigma]|eukprot:GAX83342.1 hypothetical protein CEUSTIGMA_g10767.t1 [Chlamydomonas eustigma]
MQIESLVPLNQCLFPPALAFAFGLPSLDGKPVTLGSLCKDESVSNRLDTSDHNDAKMQQKQLTSCPVSQPTKLGSQAGIPSYPVGNVYMPYPPYASALPSVFGPNMYGTMSQAGLNGVQPDFSNLSYSSGAVHGGGHSQFSGRFASAAPSQGDTVEKESGDGARAIKRARLVWTPQLHKRFEDALLKLGPEKAIPKNIMQEMNVEGLSRENVASHLQKFRLLRKAPEDITPTATAVKSDKITSSNSTWPLEGAEQSVKD